MKVASASPVGAPCAAADSHQQEEASDGGEYDHRRPLEESRGLASEFQRVFQCIDEQEGEQADRQRKQEVHAVPADTAKRRIEHQPDRDRNDADEDAEQRLRDQTRPVGSRGGDGDRDFVLERSAGVRDDVDDMRLAKRPRETERVSKRSRRARSARADPA